MVGKAGRGSTGRSVKVHAPSRVRIDSGRLRGRYVSFFEREDLRPTLARARIAVFNMIRELCLTHGFIDLCAGSGVFGFEAWSMGFEPVFLIDTNPAIIQTLNDNARALQAQVTIWRGSAWELERLNVPSLPYVIYADPPYRESAFHQPMMTHLSRLDQLAPGSVYVAEGEQAITDQEIGQFTLWKYKRYGRLHIGLFRKEVENEAGSVKDVRGTNFYRRPAGV